MKNVFNVLFWKLWVSAVYFCDFLIYGGSKIYLRKIKKINIISWNKDFSKLYIWHDLSQKKFEKKVPVKISRSLAKLKKKASHYIFVNQ